MSKFKDKLQQADSEKIVESLYHQELERALKASDVEVIDIKTSVKTDGIIDTNFQFNGKTIAMKIILEVKKDETFQTAVVRSKALVQVLYYIKKLDTNGYELPHIVLVGDNNECFVLHTNFLVDYLKKDINWNIAPSKAPSQYPDLVLELTNDDKLQTQCYVYPIDSDFKLETVVEKMKGLTVNTLVKVRVNEKNISKIFEYFSMNVLSRKSNGQAKYTPREQVELFMHLVNNKEDCYIHPNKPGKAIFKNTEVDVRRDAFNQFKNHYEFNYTIEEKKEFTAIADRLIEDSDRRFKGDFYTGQVWVDECHKMITENLGQNWKDEYMVYDCACGTGNLTRDYKFQELYTSTLEDHDLKIGEKYNQGSVKFQYDFLNDDVDIMDNLLKKVEEGHKLTEKDFYGTKLWQKAPGLIRGLLTGKKLVYIINPPYGTAKNGGADSVSKKGIAVTKINEKMLRDKIGASSQQLYAQFLYRITQITKIFKNETTIGIFSPPAFLTGTSFKGLRKHIFGEYTHEEGIIFQASEFADVKDNWGISFNIFKTGKATEVNYFKLDVVQNTESGVQKLREKTLYNLDNIETLSEWIKTKEKGEDAPQMTSAIAWNNTKNRGTLVPGALGNVVFNANNVQQSNQLVTILSSCMSAGMGVSILEENFNKIVSGFTARRLITGQYSTWVNWQDEYMIPNTNHELYPQWQKDSIIYSLFDTKSNQSSLRNIEYNGKTWNIYNHFFFMSKDEILALATNNDHINNSVEQDIYDHGQEERFVYTKIKEIEEVEEVGGFSPDAQAVLNKARELVRSSFKYRQLFNMEHPEYQIETWDSGWYQIKGLLKEYDPQGLKEFTELYKSFEDRLRPLVYTLGFLYQ